MWNQKHETTLIPLRKVKNVACEVVWLVQKDLRLLAVESTI
jgi:hypothetical protein